MAVLLRVGQLLRLLRRPKGFGWFGITTGKRARPNNL
jgi:hypothetical protein